MDEEHTADYPLKTNILPCCGAKVELDHLEYDWPQGFARFSLEVMNPEKSDLTQPQVEEIERVLGLKVRKILRHT